MNELIKIKENNGKRAVSARELHSFLEAKERFANWIARQFQYGFIENVDFVGCKEFNALANQELNDYALTIDCAKEISMLQKSDKGKEARQYFIEMEKIAVNALQPLSESELILRSAQMLVSLERNQKAIEARVKAIEERPQINSEVQHFSILGFCNNIHKQISINEAKIYGQKCRRLCNELGMVIGKIADPRFGSVNTYPLDILREVIK